MFDIDQMLNRVLLLVPMLLSLTVHEWAHAFSAHRLGDDTAERQGRLTLNPIVHIDPIGTLLLPLLGIPFGWAKPVPVNPARFRRGVSMGTGMMITAAAGPFSNVVLATLCAIGLGLGIRFGAVTSSEEPLAHLVIMAITINVSLALFNLLPVPPLDGSRVVDGLIPYKQRPLWERYVQYSSIVFFVVVVFGSRLLAGPMHAMMGLVWKLVLWIAGT